MTPNCKVYGNREYTRIWQCYNKLFDVIYILYIFVCVFAISSQTVGENVFEEDIMCQYRLLQLDLTCLSFRNTLAYRQIGFLVSSDIVIVKCIHNL